MPCEIQRYNDNRPAPSDAVLERERAGGVAGGWRTVVEDAGGGSQTAVYAFDLTADSSNSFTDSHDITYDEIAGIAQVEVTVTAFDADGLPVDNSGGILGAANLYAIDHLGALRLAPSTAAWVIDVVAPPDLTAIGSAYTSIQIVPQEVRYTLSVVSFDDGLPYAGPNFPSISAHVIVTFVG